MLSTDHSPWDLRSLRLWSVLSISLRLICVMQQWTHHQSQTLNYIMGDCQPCPPYLWNHKKYQIQPCPGIQSWWDSNDWLNKITWIFIKLRLLLFVKPRAFQGYTPKIWRNKRKRHTIINMQKLWRRDYNFNVSKDQLPPLASTRIFAMKLLFSII